ncbi:MAG: type II toxin-antitoxin system death-on-curing family toxin [Candidatus Staskawiczbacteria bacterium]|nr:type II toxin-antitoxin system death-on-curing family toxin [Candidatus Staskawiczbacteria bacterium]MBI3337017.1 type II toxin-antitoxin system death-on-curing family toxin [Candidatus Staskawiczbacteria bacterium]
MRPKSLSLAEIEFIAFRLAEKFMTWNEPIPDFGSRFPNILESCLNQPFVQFSKKDLYRGLVGKASIMFYLMIKNHPFQNGNKRIAIMSLLYFLNKNGKWLNIDNKTLYNFTKNIATSKPQSREKITIYIQSIIKKHLIDFPVKNDNQRIS